MFPDLVNVKEFLLGGIAAGDLIAGLFFLRYWRVTGDRFFLFFAWSFALGALSRAVLAMDVVTTENEPLIYLVRLASYALILVGIVDKNRGAIRKILFQRSVPARPER